MSGIFTDEILSEMMKITGQEKVASEEHDLKVDESQFEMFPEPIADEYLSLASAPMTNMVVVADADGLDKDILKEKKKATNFDDIIDQAHPETAFMADGPMGTGVVENQNEQHTKILNVVYKDPTGFHFNTMASIMAQLTKVADALEAKGDLKAVKEIDATLAAIRTELKKKVANTPAPLDLPAMELIKAPYDKIDKYRKPYELPRPPPRAPQPPKPSVPQTALVKRPGRMPDEVLPPEAHAPKGLPPSGQKASPSAKPSAAPPNHKPQAGPVSQDMGRIGPAQPKALPGPADQTPRQRGNPVPPGSGQVRHHPAGTTQPGAAQPSTGPTVKGKGVGGGRVMGLLRGVGTSLKGKGKAGVMAAALGAGAVALYQLWDGMKTEWEKHIGIAQNEMSDIQDPQLRATVDALASVGRRVEGMLYRAITSKEMDPERLEEIGDLLELANGFAFNVPDNNVELKRAAINLQRLAMEFDRQGKLYVDHLLRRENLEAEADSERIASLQRWIKDNADPNIQINGISDPYLTRYLEFFVSDVKKKFGPKFNPTLFNAKNLLRGANYEVMDQLHQVWKYPRTAIGEDALGKEFYE